MSKPQKTVAAPAPQSETINPFDLSSLLAEYDDKPPEKPAEGAGGGKKPPAKPVATAAEDDDEGELAAPAKKTFAHSAKAIRKGKEVGLTDEEMAGMELDDLADEIVFRHQTARYHAEGAARAAIEVGGKSKTSPEADLSAAKAPDFGGAVVEDIDDNIVLALKHFAARIAALEGELAGARKSTAEREARSVNDRLDELFKASPAHFGDKPAAKVKVTSPEGAKRLAVVSYMRNLGDERTTLETDFAAACAALGFVTATDDDDEEVEKWNKSGLAKPSPRKDPPKPRGEARAKESSLLANAMERAGISVGGSNGVASLDDFAD